MGPPADKDDSLALSNTTGSHLTKQPQNFMHAEDTTSPFFVAASAVNNNSSGGAANAREETIKQVTATFPGKLQLAEQNSDISFVCAEGKENLTRLSNAAFQPPSQADFFYDPPAV